MDTPHHHNATSGCFAVMFRRILCKDGLPTHPSDDIPESKPTHNHVDLHHEEDRKTEARRVQPPATPGVVARLMGLESLPDTNIDRVLNGPDLVSRSRSVNFMDYLLKFDFADPSQQQQHRRVRSSVSFREVPETAPTKPSEVFVLYLENVDEKKKLGSKQRKSDVGTQNLKQRRQVRPKVVVKKKEKVSKLKDEPRRVSAQRCSKSGKDLDLVTPKKKEICRKHRVPIKVKASTKPVNRKEAVNVQKTEHDQCSSSVDSSPVSVLDLGEFSSHQFPEEPITNMEKKSSAKLADNQIPTLIADVEDSSFSNEETEYLMELRSKLCRLAEEDIEESKWSTKSETEEMCVELGSQIFNQLLDELVLVPF